MLAEVLISIETKKGRLHAGDMIDISEVTAGKLSGKIRLLRSIPTTTPAKVSEPEWQHDFCIAHAEFNHCRGSCPCSIGDCLISRVVDAGGDIDKLRGLEIGQGITTDMVIDGWQDAGEPAEELFENPTWLICMAEVICSCK